MNKRKEESKERGREKETKLGRKDERKQFGERASKND
jgi:hypothetical protein